MQSMQRRSSPEIEIIPWFHFQDTTLHANGVKYLESIQAGSDFFWEPTANAFKLCEMVAGGDSPRKIERFYNAVSGSKADIGEIVGHVEQLYEIFEVCKARNLHFLPLDTPKIKAIEVRSRGSGELNRIKVNIQRENLWLKRICVRAATTKKGKIYISTGTYHAQSLRNLLSDAGLRATVQTGFFTGRQQKDIEYLIHSGFEVRKAYLEKRWHDAYKIYIQREIKISSLWQKYRRGYRSWWLRVPTVYSLTVGKRKSRPKILLPKPRKRRL